MNHISKSFTSDDGRIYKSHSWEQREGGYRRCALILGNGLWSVSKETRLVDFLLDRGFRVLSLESAFGSIELPRTRLKSFRDAVASFAKETLPEGLPLYLIATSFSGSALLPAAAEIRDIAALALISPVIDLSAPKFKVPLFFLPKAELTVEREYLSGMPELLSGFLESDTTLKFHKRDLKAAAADISKALEKGFSFPVAAFAGESDPYLGEASRLALAKAGAKVFSYPRVRREPGHDRYADNYYADLGSFLDEVEAGKSRP